MLFPRHHTGGKRNLFVVFNFTPNCSKSIVRSFSDQLLSVSSSIYSPIQRVPPYFLAAVGHCRALIILRSRFCLPRHTTCLNLMKQIVKIITLLVTIFALWIGLIQMSLVPRNYTWLLPIYLIVSLGCYGLLMVGVGLMRFPTCPQEAVLLQKDICEGKDYLKQEGVDVGSD